MIHTPKPRQRKVTAPRRLERVDTLGDRIYEELRRRLQHSPLAPTERLVDTEVAAAYGTSRMPAREALLRLVNEGYLIGTTRGFITPTLSLDEVRDIFEVRLLLEPAAIASVAPWLDGSAEQELTKALKRALRAAAENDGEEMLLANMAFRNAWLDRVKNRRLAATIGRFVDHVQKVRLLTLTSVETRQIVADGLSGLFEALIKRDAALTHERMLQFMGNAQAAFFKTSEATAREATPPADAARQFTAEGAL